MRKIEDFELTSELLRDIRNSAAELAYDLDIPPSRWRNRLADMYRDLNEPITDEFGREEFISLQCFEGTDEFVEENDNVRTWFRDFVKRVPPHVTPQVQARAIPRVLAFANIFAATHPERASHWRRKLNAHFVNIHATTELEDAV